MSWLSLFLSISIAIPLIQDYMLVLDRMKQKERFTLSPFLLAFDCPHMDLLNTSPFS